LGASSLHAAYTGVMKKLLILIALIVLASVAAKKVKAV